MDIGDIDAPQGMHPGSQDFFGLALDPELRLLYEAIGLAAVIAVYAVALFAFHRGSLTRRSKLLACASLSPLIAFLVAMLAPLAGLIPSQREMASGIRHATPLATGLIAAIPILAICQLVVCHRHISRNRELTRAGKSRWRILVLLLNFLIFPIYCRLHMLRTEPRSGPNPRQ